MTPAKKLPARGLKPIATLKGPIGPAAHLAFNPDGTRLAAASDRVAMNEVSFLLANLAKPSAPLILKHQAPQADVKTAGVAFLGEQLLVAIWQRTEHKTGYKSSLVVLVYDAQGALVRQTAPIPLSGNGSIGSCVVSADQSLVAVSASSEKTYLWKAADLRAGKKPQSVNLGGSGSAAPLAFAGNDLFMPLASDDEHTEIVTVRSDGKITRVATGLDCGNAISCSSDHALLMGGNRNGLSALFDRAGSPCAQWKETFEVSTLAGDLIVGASSHASALQRGLGWKAPKDGERKTGFVGVASTDGTMRGVHPLGLKPDDTVRGIAVRPGTAVAVGLNNELRVFDWNDVV